MRQVRNALRGLDAARPRLDGAGKRQRSTVGKVAGKRSERARGQAERGNGCER